MDRVRIPIAADGSLVLPPAARQRLRLDAPEAQVEVRVRADGVVELHPCASDPDGQAWFWSPGWQEREREVDAVLAAGEMATYDTVEQLISGLDADPA